MNAYDIQELLAEKHTNDVFVRECKDGPTWGGNHLRIDAWAMNRSWAHPCTTGYEIKVNRYDFLHDVKHMKYLEFCNMFYFVAPEGLIDVKEVANEIGLLIVSKTGKRLFTKKKALYRELEIPETLYRYILMCRAKITDERGDGGHKGKTYWKNWLKEKDEQKDIGACVSKKVQKLLKEKIDDVATENKTLVNKISEYREIEEFLKKLGFDNPQEYGELWGVENKIKEAMTGLPSDFQYNLENVIVGLTHIKENING